MPVRHFHVVGRHKPTDTDPNPKIFRMKLFAPNEVTAKSRFWYFLTKLHKLKKATGEILAVNELFEKNPGYVKNYGIWLRYNSRSGTHNMYKEFRDITLTGAVTRMYNDMAGRHRARDRSIQVIRTTVIPASECRRKEVQEYHNSKIKFPLAHVQKRTLKQFRTNFVADRPITFFN